MAAAAPWAIFIVAAGVAAAVVAAIARLLASLALRRSHTGPRAPFDICIVTASNPQQASLFREMVARRRARYPPGLRFKFYSDPPGGRVGSGGGTLVALASLVRDELGVRRVDPDTVRAFLASVRVLLIHAGGESRRLPCYVPEGKLFAPVPPIRRLARGAAQPSAAPTAAPAILDLMLDLYLSGRYPWPRPGAGEGAVVLASGDAIVDFDGAALLGGADAAGEPRRRADICGFGCPAPFSQGARHGVFELRAESGGAGGGRLFEVADFHQKAPAARLAARARIPASAAHDAPACAAAEGACALDIGVFELSAEWCAALFGAAAEPLVELRRRGSGEGGGSAEPPTLLEAVERASISFDFYLEAVSACVPRAGGENEYVSLMCAQGSALPMDGMRALYRHLRRFALHAALPPRALFVHFGSLSEYSDACARVLEREARDAGGTARAADRAHVLLVNSDDVRVRTERSPAVVPPAPAASVPPAGAQPNGHASPLPLVEMCSHCTLTLGTQVGARPAPQLLVGLTDFHAPSPIPPGICLDGRRLALAPGRPSVRVVLVYSGADSFKRVAHVKDALFCGRPLLAWLAARGLPAALVLGEAVSARGPRPSPIAPPPGAARAARTASRLPPRRTHPSPSPPCGVAATTACARARRRRAARPLSCGTRPSSAARRAPPTRRSWRATGTRRRRARPRGWTRSSRRRG